jgi:hypothetical protein
VEKSLGPWHPDLNSIQIKELAMPNILKVTLNRFQYPTNTARDKCNFIPLDRGYMIIVYMSFCILFNAVFAFANDTITEITPQGLHFMTTDNISIERENLYISLNKIEVSYIFRNNSANDITAEVAFPVAPYYGGDVANVPFSHYPLGFGDFEVEVNGKLISCKKEVRAYTKGKNVVDITDFLRDMNISIEDFAGTTSGGGFGGGPIGHNAIEKLPKEDREKLLKLGAIDSENIPYWIVDIKYYWKQKFPANSTVSIKHRYTPYYGSRFDVFQPSPRWPYKEGEMSTGIVKESCLAQNIKESLEKKMITKVNETGKMTYLGYSWVSYILTTANNWQGPIKEFHLIIEKPEGSILSLCFDNKIVKSGPTRFEAQINNFIPKRDLKIYFISEKGESTDDNSGRH